MIWDDGTLFEIKFPLEWRKYKPTQSWSSCQIRKEKSSPPTANSSQIVWSISIAMKTLIELQSVPTKSVGPSKLPNDTMLPLFSFSLHLKSYLFLNLESRTTIRTKFDWWLYEMINHARQLPKRVLPDAVKFHQEMPLYLLAISFSGIGFLHLLLLFSVANK